MENEIARSYSTVHSEKFSDFNYDLTWFLRLSLRLEDALLFSKNPSMRLFWFNSWKGQEVRSPKLPTSSLIKCLD